MKNEIPHLEVVSGCKKSATLFIILSISKKATITIITTLTRLSEIGGKNMVSRLTIKDLPFTS
jgi:hypothetical protein